MASDENGYRSRARLPAIWAIALAVAFSIITGYYHHHLYLGQANAEAVTLNHFEVVEGRALAPTQYRPAPYLAAQAILDLSVDLGARNDSRTLLLAYLGLRLVATAFAYYVLLLFLGRWFDPARTVLGLCFLVAVNPLAEYQYFHQPGDPWTFLLFILGFLALASRRDGWLVPIIFLGTPVRETILLLIPAYLAVRWGEIPWPRLAWWTLLMVIAFLVPAIGLRVRYGPLESYMIERLAYNRDPSILIYNLTHPDGWIVLLLYFNVLWVALPLAWKRLPRVIRRAFIMVPLFFLLHLFWGRLVEGRLYLPILPLFLPAGLMLLGPLRDGDP